MTTRLLLSLAIAYIGTALMLMSKVMSSPIRTGAVILTSSTLFNFKVIFLGLFLLALIVLLVDWVI